MVLSAKQARKLKFLEKLRAEKLSEPEL